MKFGVVRFPGSCDDVDALLAVRRVGDAVMLWHADRDLQGVDAVIIPGGFSYGDYLRPGAIARFSPVMEAVAEFAAQGGPVLGICNGFQVLCEAGLLPGALLPNDSLRFVCRHVHIEVANAATPFTAVAFGPPPLRPAAAIFRRTSRATAFYSFVVSHCLIPNDTLTLQAAAHTPAELIRRATSPRSPA